MTFIIRNSDGTIKTYASRGDDFILQPGETMDLSPLSMVEYAARFTLSAAGFAGDLIHVHVADPQVKILVSCPAQLTVDLDINGTIETLQLTNGEAEIILSTAVPGVYIIQPADRRTYAAAGQGTLTLEVLP
jgi:hypothetical protein